MIAAVLLVAAAGATSFAWWGNPRMSEGGLIGPGEGMSWANDGVTNTRMVVRGRHAATVTATFSVRNDGHLPFTLHGLDVDTFEWLSHQQVTFEPGIPGFNGSATTTKQLTLAPGEEATVHWSLTMTCQPPPSEGGFITIDFLRFRLSWLGIATTRDLPLKQPITFTSDNEVPGVPPC
ncbi:hypothetical protein [Actinoplanes regularis]|uniref:hypothetical protein n=1 Tax=Actinoplanes regularis TaxID=52697 RepID=UPI0024A30FCF|nr:hypothetical protein [Actinoplanes regularis]GLW35195.1 hypothetical protein Areg01_81310 [Actinoplanes regularis]